MITDFGFVKLKWYVFIAIEAKLRYYYETNSFTVTAYSTVKVAQSDLSIYNVPFEV